jgi:hypothetical protein
MEMKLNKERLLMKFLLLLGIILVLILISSRFSKNKRGNSSKGRFEKFQKKRIEKQVLRLAKENKGVVTPVLVAEKTSLSLNESDEYLKTLVKNGYADIKVTNKGKIKYIIEEYK